MRRIREVLSTRTVRVIILFWTIPALAGALLAGLLSLNAVVRSDSIDGYLALLDDDAGKCLDVGNCAGVFLLSENPPGDLPGGYPTYMGTLYVDKFACQETFECAGVIELVRDGSVGRFDIQIYSRMVLSTPLGDWVRIYIQRNDDGDLISNFAFDSTQSSAVSKVGIFSLISLAISIAVVLVVASRQFQDPTKTVLRTELFCKTLLFLAVMGMAVSGPILSYMMLRSIVEPQMTMKPVGLSWSSWFTVFGLAFSLALWALEFLPLQFSMIGKLHAAHPKLIFKFVIFFTITIVYLGVMSAARHILFDPELFRSLANTPAADMQDFLGSLSGWTSRMLAPLDLNFFLGWTGILLSLIPFVLKLPNSKEPRPTSRKRRGID